jgi:hypothetical protein
VTFSASIFRRATNQPAIQIRRAYVKWKEILLRPAQRFGERQPFDGSIWITYCSGLRQISKTSCSISEPTLTTIGRMIHWKDERRIRPCLDQSQISARFAGNRTVEPCTRRRWPPDLIRDSPWLQYSVDLGRTSKKSFAVFLLQALPRWDRFPAADAFRKWNSSDSRNAMSDKTGPSQRFARHRLLRLRAASPRRFEISVRTVLTCTRVHRRISFARLRQGRDLLTLLASPRGMASEAGRTEFSLGTIVQLGARREFIQII